MIAVYLTLLAATGGFILGACAVRLSVRGTVYRDGFRMGKKAACRRQYDAGYRAALDDFAAADPARCLRLKVQGSTGQATRRPDS